MTKKNHFFLKKEKNNKRKLYGIFIYNKLSNILLLFKIFLGKDLKKNWKKKYHVQFA